MEIRAAGRLLSGTQWDAMGRGGRGEERLRVVNPQESKLAVSSGGCEKAKKVTEPNRREDCIREELGFWVNATVPHVTPIAKAFHAVTIGPSPGQRGIACLSFSAEHRPSDTFC